MNIISIREPLICEQNITPAVSALSADQEWVEKITTNGSTQVPVAVIKALEKKPSNIPMADMQQAPNGADPMRCLVDALSQEGLINKTQEMEWRAHLADDKLDATLQVLKAWELADSLGKRSKLAPQLQCLIPNQVKYPGATQTPFRLDNLSLLLGEELPASKEYLTRSFKYGFDIEIETDPKSVTYRNKEIEDNARMALQLGINEDFSLGYSARRSHLEPVFIGNPVSCIPKKRFGRPIVPNKFRRIQNPSKGKDGYPSVNEGISSENAALTYATVQQGAQSTLDLKRQHPGSQVFYSKWDMKAAYRQLPLREDQCGLLGFTAPDGREFVELRVPFGVRSGCRLYSSLSSAVAWILHHVLGCDAMLVYIDDYLLIACDKARSDVMTKIVNLTFKLLGLLVEDAKTEESKVRIVFLGVRLDSIAETLSMPWDRKILLLAVLQEWAQREKASINEIQSLCGSLVFASRTCPNGKLFLGRLFARVSVLSKYSHPDAQQELGVEIKKDIKWWINFLPVWDGTCRMKHAHEASIVAPITILGDASNKAVAGVNESLYYQIRWEGETSVLELKHINIKELYAVVTSACTWGSLWTGRRVLFRCDNMSSVLAVSHWKSTNCDTMHLLRVLHFSAAIHDFEFKIEHIKGVQNIVADAASRQSEVELKLSQPQLVRIRPTLPPSFKCENWEAKASAQLLQRVQTAESLNDTNKDDSDY